MSVELQEDGTYYPTAEELLNNPSQDGTLLRFHRSKRSFIQHWLWMLVALIIAYRWSINFDYFPWLKGLYLLPVLIFVNIIRLILDDEYTLEQAQIRKVDGKLSLKYKRPVIQYRDIRGIVIQQGIWGRLLNFGNLYIGTAAESGSEMCLPGVVDPQDLAELIDELRRSVERDTNPLEIAKRRGPRARTKPISRQRRAPQNTT